MCKCVILLPLFVTLLLIDEDPYVGVDVIHDLNPTSSNAKRGRSENNSFLKSSSLAICAFPSVSLNIYHRRFGPPMNHVSFLETDISV